jgi:lambda family phage tail tape measure protein
MKLAEQYGVQVESATKLIDRGQGLALIEKDRENTLVRITTMMEQQAKTAEALTAARLKMGETKQDLAFQASIIGKSPLQKQLATIAEDSRKAALEAGRAFASSFEDTGDGMTPERMKQLQDGLTAIQQGYAGITKAQSDNLLAGRDWNTGWNEAFMTYAENAGNAAQQAKDYFESFTKGMEDALVNFVRTGKLSFSDLANSMISQFIRIQTQKALTGVTDLFGGGGGGGFGDLFNGVKKIFGFAGGGQPPVNRPSLVGESGPELFVPKTSGTIIPNNQLGGGGGTTIINNISAIDSRSVQQLFAEHRMTLFGNVEQARRELPMRTR